MEIKKIGTWLASAALMAPVLVFAQAAPPDVSITTTGGVIGLLLRILDLARIIFWIVAVAMILYAAFLYLTAGGDPIKVGKANATLRYAIVAIVVALIATSLPFLVRSLLGGS
jgi:hypothetical protein